VVYSGISLLNKLQLKSAQTYPEDEVTVAVVELAVLLLGDSRELPLERVNVGDQFLGIFNQREGERERRCVPCRSARSRGWRVVEVEETSPQRPLPVTSATHTKSENQYVREK
jgi:hypothetical protein